MDINSLAAGFSLRFLALCSIIAQAKACGSIDDRNFNVQGNLSLWLAGC
jgi:hypothetical protein